MPETAENPMIPAAPQPQHKWLQKLAGEWTYEGSATMEPGKPPMKFTGTEKVRSIGGLWAVAEATGDMPGGGSATMILTLGYDSEKKRYVGTWAGSMMTHLWVYDGALDTTGKMLTLDSQGPNMAAPGTTTRFKDIIEFESDDHRVLRSQMLGDDGQWHEVMEAHYRRRQ